MKTLYTIYFTNARGDEAKITGDEHAVHTIEKAFQLAGCSRSLIIGN